LSRASSAARTSASASSVQSSHSFCACAFNAASTISDEGLDAVKNRSTKHLLD
jgi:hypothetical protein